MQLHINEFMGGQITAAYTADSETFDLGYFRPMIHDGGNAILFREFDDEGTKISDREMVISAPRSEGSVIELFGEPKLVRDLSLYFGRGIEPYSAPLTEDDHQIYCRIMGSQTASGYMLADERDAHVMHSALDPDRALAPGLAYQRGIGIIDPSNPACWEDPCA